MAPRPRNKANTGLPANLYPNGRAFKYRRPDDGSWHGMGTDRQKAIQAAKQLNGLLTSAGENLVAGVMGTSETLAEFIAVFRAEILPARNLAKGTLALYDIRFRQIIAALGARQIDSITIGHVSDFLDSADLKVRPSNQCRAMLADIFNHAAAKGKCADNPAALTIPRLESKARHRHTFEGLMKIREASPDWLRNAIDLALVTVQRRGDILAMRFDHIENGYLAVIQEKTEKASDAGYLKIKITPQRQAVIDRCRDNVVSPYLIHRKPDRIRAKARQDKDHWTQVDERYLSRAFQAARKEANPYPKLSDEQQPGFHEIRALAIHLLKAAGKDAQKIAGHAQAKMTNHYASGHEEIVWISVEDEVEIKELRK